MDPGEGADRAWPSDWAVERPAIPGPRPPAEAHTAWSSPYPARSAPTDPWSTPPAANPWTAPGPADPKPAASARQPTPTQQPAPTRPSFAAQQPAPMQQPAPAQPSVPTPRPTPTQQSAVGQQSVSAPRPAPTHQPAFAQPDHAAPPVPPAPPPYHQWPLSGYPPGPAQWPPPVPARPSRRRVALRLTAAATLLLVLCAVPGVWAFGRIAPALTKGAAGPGPAVSDIPSSTSPRSPQPGDPPATRVRTEIDIALAAQTKALLGGNEAGFAASAGTPAIKTELTRRYRSLKAMQVTRWEPAIAARLSQSGAEWTGELTLKHCFVVAACEPENVQVQSRWVERDGNAFLTYLESSTANENGPRPWEVADLRVSVGKRVVVATTAKYSSRLPSLIGEAEKAAVVADRFVVGAPAPDRYHVYFAGGPEWKQWFSGNRPEWAAGYAVPTSTKRIDVVLNAAETPSTFIDDIMRHEMSHVASLRGAKHQGNETWWLVEGLAEHAEMNGKPAKQYDAVVAGAVRSYVRAGWTGTVAVTEPDAGAALREAGARYGIAFLAFRRLVDRYGEAKVLRFFAAVVHEGDPVVRAAPAEFGSAWTAVEADCVSYIRSTVG